MLPSQTRPLHAHVLDRPRRTLAAGPLLRAAVRALAAYLIAAGTVQAQDCTPTASVTAEPDGWFALDLHAPCAPYAAVEVTLGPLRVAEELSLDGHLRTVFPVLTDVASIGMRLDGTSIEPALPDTGLPAPHIAAVIWPDGVAWGLLELRGAESGPAVRLGYPGTSPMIDVQASGEGGDLALRVPVTPETCGRVLAAELLEGGGAVVPVSVHMPSCEAVGQIVSLPLPF